VIDVLEHLGDGRSGADSSIIITYELDLPIYEGWVRRRLSSAGTVNQVVFCDVSVYERELGALSSARHIGKSYSVTPIRRAGAFHPKVYLLLGRTRGRLLVGSGNVTVGGLLRNAELFGLFDYDREKGLGPHPAFGVAVDFVQNLAQESSELVKKQITRAVSWAPWLREAPNVDGRTLLIGGEGRPALLNQISSLLNGKRPRSAVVLSASFDRRLVALKKLAEGTSEGRVRCIVQASSVDLDGKAVERLGKTVQWYPFVDPYPKEKKRRKDVRVHAKLIALDCGDQELVIYGSANSSRPALLDEDGNTEVVVAFWHSGPRSICEYLGLQESLRTARIDRELVKKVWRAEDDGRAGGAHECLLAGAVVYGRHVDLTIVDGEVERNAMLAISESVNRPPLTTAAVHRGDAGGFEARLSVPPEARIARVMSSAGRPLSNFVAFTWPEVGEPRGRSGLGSRGEAALAAMQDGVVLGTVLFELLNYYRDFEVVMARPAGKQREHLKAREAEVAEVPGRAVETFYTDAGAEMHKGEAWVGDRADLDLLAALVQPLRVGLATRGQEAEEEEDDSAIEEEAERRQIDARRGQATGDERRESIRFASRESLERAVRRLASRLTRSARSIEDTLSIRDKVVGVRASSIARQIWMTHIAAFLGERLVLSSENEEIRCLDARMLAHYVIRVCRALSGGKDAGVLSLVPPETWAGPDGEVLRRGLAFLWTCCLWATAYLRQNTPEEIGTPWEAVPELVAARFVAAVRSICQAPDQQDITRRLPVCGDPESLRAWGRNTSRLADLIVAIETKGKPPQELTREAVDSEPGALVFHPSVGVTVLVDRERRFQGAYTLLDLSKGDPPFRKFLGQVIELRAEGWPIAWSSHVQGVLVPKPDIPKKGRAGVK
jgi:hypothetical protein